MPCLIVRQYFPGCPNYHPQENRIRCVASQNEQTHADQYKNGIAEGSHIGIKQGHAAVVKSRNSIEDAYPPAIQTICCSCIWSIVVDPCAHCERAQQLPSSKVHRYKPGEKQDCCIFFAAENLTLVERKTVDLRVATKVSSSRLKPRVSWFSALLLRKLLIQIT